MKGNPHLSKLSPSYLFPEIERRAARYPDAISLGIGDVTGPLPEPVQERIRSCRHLTGYGPSAGLPELREAISEKIYRALVAPDEIFISDGAKCDIARLQMLFAPDATVALQDPTYPVYLETSLLSGRRVHLLPCTPENNFFPENVPKVDLLYLCSPNNPTGTAATHKQLAQVIQPGTAIIFDAAYAAFIRDPALPRSIFEVDGAREVAIELGSFSKFAGFTGLRLGWTAMSKEHPLYSSWVRLQSTLFNGASLVSQIAGLTALDYPVVDGYMENAQLLKKTLPNAYGGEQAPYLWLPCPGKSSWEMFDHFLEEYGLITTPGIGFGPSGEGYLRLSAFGSHAVIQSACERFRNQNSRS